MTIALIIIAISLGSIVLLMGHSNHERRRYREWSEARRQTATIRARRPKHRPF